MESRPTALDGAIRTFAHRGASAQAAPDTMAALRLGRRLGVQGISSTVRATADGIAVLHRSRHLGSRLRRHPLATMAADHLPDEVVTVSALYSALGVVDLLLDVAEPAAFDAVLAAARARGENAEHRLWLCSPDLDRLIEWRTRTSARLVNSVAPRRLTARPEQLAARLRQTEIDGLQLFHQDWNGGLVTLMHRFERYALGWGVEHEREIARLIHTGIDGISGRFADRLAAGAEQLYHGDQ